MNAYEQMELAQFRRATLRYLLAQPDGQLSESLLTMQLEAEVLYKDQTARRAELAWLADRGLVSVRQIGTMQLVQLLDRGRIVALGKQRVDGIADASLPGG